ncbi:histone deacetylase complex subunit SAP25-like [Eleginops maclovinus]|uniref:histone deacetylase complex subunit SAP25-like n=1 Tax=Eleginops maclovinus TaxID=56733 RepID=UPI0030809E0E
MEGFSLQRPRQHTLPPFSNRTLNHPSFMPVYMAAGLAHQDGDCSQTVHPLGPEDFFYSDPNVTCGRIPNVVSDLKVFECFKLNTPPPLMSACPAPPPCPDPFRFGTNPTRNLGLSTAE